MCRYSGFHTKKGILLESEYDHAHHRVLECGDVVEGSEVPGLRERLLMVEPGRDALTDGVDLAIEKPDNEDPEGMIADEDGVADDRASQLR